MNFASIQFLVFLVLLFAGYLLVRRHQAQNVLLLVASYYFYACWDARFLLLIWLVTGVSYAAGRAVHRAASRQIGKRYVIAYAVFVLSILSYFKYANFFIESAQTLLISLGIRVEPLHLQIILPAAISFYVFESLCYVIEIWKGRLPATATLGQYALFIAYFPKLVAGPIERPAVLIPQIQKPRTVNEENLTRGLFLILLGLFKKVVVADGLAPTVDSVFNRAVTPGSIDIIIGVYAFALQIYCDFSGYTDIARGVSKLFGIELSQNFRFPYFSSNASEFWKRWHISLSSWLRDYLYVPLGGNRFGEWRTRLNLMLTMLLGGLWHGAAWNYIFWGAYQGALLVAFRFVPDLPKGGLKAVVARVLATALFFQFVCYGWLLFRSRSLHQAYEYSVALVAGSYAPIVTAARPPLATLLGVAVLCLYDLLAYRSGRATFYRAWPAPLRAALYAALTFLTLMGLANARSAFIYFQF